jgi:hypothetical protein
MSILDDLVVPALQQAGKQAQRLDDAVAYGCQLLGLPLVITVTDIRDGFFLHVTINPSLTVSADQHAVLETLLGLDYTATALMIGRDPRDGEIMLHAALPIWYGQPTQDGLIDFLHALEGETARYLTILAQVASGKQPPTIVFGDAP